MSNRNIVRYGRLAAPALLLGVLAGCSLWPTEPAIDARGFDRAVRVADDVPASALMPWVEQLSAARAGDVKVNHDGFTPGELYPVDQLTRDAAVAIVSSAFASMGYAPETVVLGAGPQAAYNVAAEWRGMTRPGEVVLVGSHLDAFYAGADDNGSAVAAMLATAQAVRNHRFARTIRFVAFDLEEFGSAGSTRYIQSGRAQDVKAAIVLDVVGYASNRTGSQSSLPTLKLPDKGDFLLVLGNEDSGEMTQKMLALGNGRGLAKLTGVVAPGDGTYFLSTFFMRSDHGLFWYRRIPTVFLTDTANYRNPNYHRATDTPDTLDAAFLARNARALAAATALFAETQE